MSRPKGFLLLSCIPLLLAALGACFTLVALAYNCRQMLTTALHEERVGNRSINELLEERMRTAYFTGCIVQGDRRLCPLAAGHPIKDFTPIFSIDTPCPHLANVQVLLRDHDDIVSSRSCTNPPLSDVVSIFHENLSLDQDIRLKNSRLISVLGNTTVTATLRVSGDLTLFSAGSVVIDTVLAEDGASVCIASTRSVKIHHRGGNGIIRIVSGSDELFREGIPLVHDLESLTWSLHTDTQG